MPIIITCFKNNIPFEYECISYNKMLRDIDKLKLHVDKILDIRIENMDMPSLDEIRGVIKVVNDLPDLKTFAYNKTSFVPTEFRQLSKEVTDRVERTMAEKLRRKDLASSLLYQLCRNNKGQSPYSVKKEISNGQGYPIMIATISKKQEGEVDENNLSDKRLMKSGKPDKSSNSPQTKIAGDAGTSGDLAASSILPAMDMNAYFGSLVPDDNAGEEKTVTMQAN